MGWGRCRHRCLDGHVGSWASGVEAKVELVGVAEVAELAGPEKRFLSL